MLLPELPCLRKIIAQKQERRDWNLRFWRDGAPPPRKAYYVASLICDRARLLLSSQHPLAVRNAFSEAADFLFLRGKLEISRVGYQAMGQAWRSAQEGIYKRNSRWNPWTIQKPASVISEKSSDNIPVKPQ